MVGGHDLVPGPVARRPAAGPGRGSPRRPRSRPTPPSRRTLAALKAAGASATGEVVSAHPIDALSAKVSEIDGREAIILTRPHVVAEFFHVDWTSQARRKIGVPVLHLLEHENFDEQAGGGEGVAGV